MALQNNRYCEYFDVDETYFPCVDESAISSGLVDWTATYPHDTFIELLQATEKMLGGSTNRSIWIHGAYGTGKSRCAYALKKILEVSETELAEYWDKYAVLKKNPVLMKQLLGHKQRGIITAYRYASGGITSSQQFFMAVQESIKKALEECGADLSESTLRESVIAWMSAPSKKVFVNELLKEPEWYSSFTQNTADEIITALSKGGDVSGLMDNIFKMAAKEGITALTLTSDSLKDWIKAVIKKNGKKIVFIWDEFSGFFRQNKNALDEFQKIVSICQDPESPFYLIVVTHPISSISGNDDSWKIVQQRFNQIEITLPDNIAFNLIADAFKVKATAVGPWRAMTDALADSVADSTSAVLKAIGMTDREVMRNILPIHPMAAFVLKNIASGFQSNQRSMFDFIKTSAELDTKAFQYFISQTGPLDDHPLLTVDMLWNFFYEKGKNYLTSDIRLILDTFPQQTSLSEKEKTVLKAILIMQAIDQRLAGQFPILKATDQNLRYVFEGINMYDSECTGIAKGLVEKGILIHTPIADGKKAYSAAVLAGDNAKIEAYKKELRDKATTAKLVTDGEGIASSLFLPAPLKLRYALDMDTGAIPVATVSDFTRIMDTLKQKNSAWKFYSVLAVAKNDDEAAAFRRLIKQTIGNEAYKNIVVIDALSTPLGLQAFEEYIEYSAMSQYYQGNNNQQSKDNARKAKEVLNRSWRDRIREGQFLVYTYSAQEGERANGAAGVHAALQAIVRNRHKCVFDFERGITEPQLKLSNAKQSSRMGMGDIDVKGLIAGCEKLIHLVWNKDKYWEIDEYQTLPIVQIKKALNNFMEESFRSAGKVAIGDIWDFLESDFGFPPSNLSAFLTGFLLKEYSRDPYRALDAAGKPDAMTPDKLAEMIAIHLSKSPKPTYIVQMTAEEKAFYELTETAWKITANTCTDPSKAGSLVRNKMSELAYPVWCLQEVDSDGVYDVVSKYISFVQAKGDDMHSIARDIGKIAMNRPTIAMHLQKLLTSENCLLGMQAFVRRFEGGRLEQLAQDINANLLYDIKAVFSVEYSALWVGSTGEDELRKLIVEYQVVQQTNLLLNVMARNKEEAFTEWRNKLAFIGFSGELAKAKKPALAKFLDYLLKIANKTEILSENMREFLVELQSQTVAIRDLINSSTAVFEELYKPYLEGFSVLEIEEIKNSIPVQNMFLTSASRSNEIVKQAASDYLKGQKKKQLFDLWKQKSNGAKTPRVWSERYQTPILCCVPVEYYETAKRAFAVLNSAMPTDSEIQSAIEFMESTDFWSDLARDEYRDAQFVRTIIGRYSAVLTDVNRVREVLEALPVDVYDWKDSPLVRDKIKAMAKAEYEAGGSDEALLFIESMTAEELKIKLKELVQRDMDLGIKIITNGRNQ